MPFKSKTFVDEPVTRSRRAGLWEERESEDAWPQKKAKGLEQDEASETNDSNAHKAASSQDARPASDLRDYGHLASVQLWELRTPAPSYHSHT